VGEGRLIRTWEDKVLYGKISVAGFGGLRGGVEDVRSGLGKWVASRLRGLFVHNIVCFRATQKKEWARTRG
jgi:hypothetical protein